jgi:HAD superfamily hydrolase (TIGR01509 family)
MFMLRAVILDMDGTLIDSNDAHARAWVEALKQYGFEVDLNRARSLVGMGGDNYLPAIIGIEADTIIGKQISEARGEIFKTTYLPHLQPFPQARALLQRMRDDRLKLVVASSSAPDDLLPLLQKAGVDDLIEKQTSAGDVERSKPDPDIIHAALDKAGCRADEAIMLGDTPYDVEAATHAGVSIIALRCGGWSDTELKGAIAVYNDPADLLAHYQSSPLGKLVK